MSHRRFRAVAVLAITLLCADTARAGERPVVVVLESGDAVPTDELVTALRVHLNTMAEVEVGPSVRRGAMADRFGHASSLVQSGGAVLVVWIERTAGGGEAHYDYVVYAVGREPSRALAEVVRIAADGRPGIARVMALKVASLVDLVLSTPGPSGDVSRPFSRHSVAHWRSRASYAPHVEVGVVGTVHAGDVGAQGGLSFVVGLKRTTGDLELSVHAGARWLSGMHGDNDLGAVDVDEVDVALGLGAATWWPGYAVGVDLELGTRLLDARAVAVDGRTDSAFSLVPAVSAGIHGEARLGRKLALRLHVGMETAVFRQRFLVVYEPAADRGRFRAVGGLSLIWTWR